MHTEKDTSKLQTREWHLWLFTATIGLLLFYLYGLRGNTQEIHAAQGRSAIMWMVQRWGSADGQFSHGWAIPIVSLYVLWRKRHKLATAPRSTSLAGLAVVTGSLLLHWVGVRSQLTRISLISLVGLLWGIPFFLCGRQVAILLLFPCFYLGFCIPMSFLNMISLPLRLVATTISSAMLNGIGIEAVRRGTAIYSAAAGGFSFDVADACSGLHSLLAMTALTCVYAYFTQDKLWKGIILFIASVPLAVAGNIFRVLTIGVVAETIGMDTAMGLYHDYSGYLVFTAAILLMVALGELLKNGHTRWGRKRHE